MGMVIMTYPKIHFEDKIPDFLGDPVTTCVLSHVWFWVAPWTARLLSPWDFPGKNAGVGCHFLLQGIFLTQGSNVSLFHPLLWQVDSLPLYTWEACRPQLLSLCPRAWVPQLLKPLHPMACTLQQEKPPRWKSCALQWRVALLATTREGLCAATKTQCNQKCF